MKMYVNEKDLNKEEIEVGKVSYKRLIARISNNIFLFNNAPELSGCDFDFVVGSDYDEESGEYIDIYQYYLIDITQYMIEKLQELNCKDVIIAWSDKLGQYVLMVPHVGTSWDYVMTSIDYTTSLDENDI